LIELKAFSVSPQAPVVITGAFFVSRRRCGGNYTVTPPVIWSQNLAQAFHHFAAKELEEFVLRYATDRRRSEFSLANSSASMVQLDR
jgi:hypothetical protein